MGQTAHRWAAAVAVMVTAAVAVVAVVVAWRRGRGAALQVQQRERTVHCVMITGKDDCRIELARAAVDNFRQQDHPRKRLLILNHHPRLRVLDEGGGGADADVMEVVVAKDAGTSLGALRNAALDMVPDGELWTTWDDDDYRGPRYLSALAAALATTAGATAVAFTDRLEWNSNTGLMWGVQLRSGFVTLLGAKLPGVRFLDQDSMEDVTLKRQYGAGLAVLRNDPAGDVLYVRLVHSNNTSLYVDPAKAAVSAAARAAPDRDYSERELTAAERDVAQGVVAGHFARVACLRRPVTCPSAH